eukprot:6101073-Prymnesium_polylepis.1
MHDRSCKVCTSPVSSSAGSKSCDVCAEGFYRRDASTTPSSETCLACPRGFSCPWNASLASLVVKRGYWRLSALTDEAYECVNDNQTACEGDNMCKEGHAGPRCQVCLISNQYFHDGICRDCPEAGDGIAYPLAKVRSSRCAVATARAQHEDCRTAHWSSPQAEDCADFLSSDCYSGFHVLLDARLSFYRCARLDGLGDSIDVRGGKRDDRQVAPPISRTSYCHFRPAIS